MSRGAGLVAVVMSAILSSGCGTAADEGFGVGVAGYMSDVKLLEAHLTSSDPAVGPVDDAGSIYGYPVGSNLRVPEQFDFRWRTESDPKIRHARFQVRAQLPPDVLRKIAAGYEPTHTLDLYFRVRGGHAECFWSLGDVSQESKLKREAAGTSRMGADTVLEGVIVGQEIDDSATTA